MRIKSHTKKIILDDDDEFYYGVTQPYIDRMPTVDAVPVRRGRWIEHGEPNERRQYEVWYWSCSLCGAVGLKEMNYCPNCGAQMNDALQRAQHVENTLDALGGADDADS